MNTAIQLRNLVRSRRGLFTLPIILVVTLGLTAIDEELEQLRLNYAAFQSAVEDYRQQREHNGLEGVEAQDYAAYVAGLQRRVFEDCQAVIHSGSPYPDDLPCPVIVPQMTRSAEISTQAEQTPEEMIAALDAALEKGMGEYDERLLREQERVKAATPNENMDSGGGAGGGAGAGDGGSTGQSGDGGEAGGMNGDSADGDQNEGESGENESSGGESTGSQQGAEGTGGRPRGGPVDSSTGSGDEGRDSDQPEDIPDGSDDDVVARQLREAAEKETDPELKAKLWEEYRRYKRGTSG
jgi:hypothetical protein